MIPDKAFGLQNKAFKRLSNHQTKPRNDMSCKYIKPTAPDRPFKKGDFVEVMNGDHSICGGPYRVTHAVKSFARIADGREFRQSDGYWIGNNGAYPFPWLRHQPTQQTED